MSEHSFPVHRRSIIGAWLSADDGHAFSSYAQSLGLDESALATLLLVRELQLKRLANTSEKRLDAAGKVKRVSARPRNPAVESAFAAHAKSVGLRPGRAASILYLAELSERWLERALCLQGNQIDSLAV